MRRHAVGRGLLFGASTSVLAVSILHAGSRILDLPFPPFELFEALTRVLPGRLVAATIDAMVAVIGALGLGPTSVVAKAAEMAIAVAIVVVGSAVLGGLVALARRRVFAAGLAAAVAWLVAFVASAIALGAASAVGMVFTAVVMVGWGLALGWTLDRSALPSVPTPEDRAMRRRFLEGALGAIAVGSAAIVGLAALVRRGARVAGPTGSAGLTSAEVPGRLAPVPGTRAELTPNERFYRIDIDLAPPRIDAARWRLQIDGLVREPLALGLDDIRAMPAITQAVTLQCISNRVGGDLVSTSQWTGVRLAEVLRRAGVNDRAEAVHIEAADGFYESVSMKDVNDDRTLLVYAMNGAPLPIEHGFPLRIYIPDRYGMKQPKWITRLRVSDRDGGGYWVDRGWSKDAFVQTTSVIDVVRSSMMLGQAKVLPIGGMAFAGARGVSKVEVQVDDGPWSEAQLVAPPLGPLTWVLWRYDWPYVPGRHAFRVRAYDGMGKLQPTRERGPHPDGATGLHTMMATL